MPLNCRPNSPIRRALERPTMQYVLATVVPMPQCVMVDPEGAVWSEVYCHPLVEATFCCSVLMLKLLMLYKGRYVMYSIY